MKIKYVVFLILLMALYTSNCFALKCDEKAIKKFCNKKFVNGMIISNKDMENLYACNAIGISTTLQFGNGQVLTDNNMNLFCKGVK